jgi:hypothetical protein
MTLITMKVTEAAISAIEMEIAHMQSKLVALKSTRNKFTAICRLPNEILGRILFHMKPKPPTTSVVLVDFSPKRAWDQAILSCSHIYQVTISTPELWDHISFTWRSDLINIYLDRSGTLPLTIVWPASSMFTRNPKIDATLACECFRRSSAASFSTVDLSPSGLALLPPLMKQAAPNLTVLGLTLGEHNEIFLQSLNLHPALTLLCIKATVIRDPLNAYLPSLTRLDLNSICTDMSGKPILDLLRYTPKLAELLYDGVYDNDEGDHSEIPLETPGHDLILPHLRRVKFQATPRIISAFFRALSPHDHQLGTIIVKASALDSEQVVDDHHWEVLQELEVHWKAMTGGSFPSARWVSRSGFGNGRYIDIHTLAGSTPHLDVDVSYTEQHAPLYREHNMDIDSIKIVGLHSRLWTELDDLVSRHALRLKHVTFTCSKPGTSGLNEWIQTQLSKGQVIETVSFSSCGGSVLEDFEALKESGLVPHVDWV